MTVEKTKEYNSILQAFIDGKELEWRAKGTSSWNRVCNPSWDFSTVEYRIREEPKLRPYDNQEEFLKARKEHGPYLYWKNGYLDTPVRIVPEGIVLLDHYKSLSAKATTDIFFWSNLLEYKWQDGTPCGIIE